MRRAFTEKWIEGVTAEERPGDVAVRTLQSRLGAVLHYLPLAARKARKDVEYVHQLRIWTRRATAALNLYEEQVPRRRYAWMTKQLRRIRRAANAARNADALILRLRKNSSEDGAKRWLKVVRAERVEAQEELVAVDQRLSRDDRFERRVDQLLRKMQSRSKRDSGDVPVSFQDWARERLRPLVEDLFAAVPADRTDEEALHRFRIRGKKLRYALELLAGALPAEVRGKLYPILEEIQDRLGEINDLATDKAWLQRKIAETSNPKDVAFWQRLLEREQTKFDQLCQTFWEWCTPQRLSKLRRGFQSLLDGETQRNRRRKSGGPNKNSKT